MNIHRGEAGREKIDCLLSVGFLCFQDWYPVGSGEREGGREDQASR